MHLKLVAVLAAALAAQQASAQSTAFVGCPIVQDTPSVPCWLVEYDGETYYMGIQSDVSAPFNPPSLGHEVLVEGTVTDKRICGGLVIDPIRVSVMPELSPECNELRMARPGVELGFEPPRPPGPSGGRLAFDPPGGPPPASEPEPEAQHTAKTFVVPYDFDGMVSFSTPRAMTPALQYARLAEAGRIEITGYRGATRLADGSIIEEREGIARARAEEIARMLRGAGLETVEYVVKGESAPIEGGPDQRRVEITVIPES